MSAREDQLLDALDAQDAATAPVRDEVTPERAHLLARHVTLVQGGSSTPEREAERARADLAAGGTIDWARLSREVNEATLAAARADDGHDTTKVTRLTSDDVTAQAKVADEVTAMADDADANDPAALDMDKVRRYRQLRDLQAVSDAEAKAFKEEANKLEVELIEMFSDLGMQSVNVDGKNVHLHRTVYAQRAPDKTAEDVKAALLEVAPELVTETVNAQTLSAWVRELTEDDNAPGLPDELDGILTPGERFAVRVTAGRSAAKPRGTKP